MERVPGTIKIIAIGMGVAIALLTAVVVYTAADRIIGTGDVQSADEASYGDHAVALPAGARVTDITAGEGTISLLLELESGAQAIMTIDGQTGRRLGTLELLSRQ